MNLVEFQDGERSFVCRADSSPATPGTRWWWVSISGESQRYAAFRTETSDTERNVKTRVIAYYENLLVERARPREIRTSGFGRRPAVAPATATVAPKAEEPTPA
jgi:hypothetical protein